MAASSLAETTHDDNNAPIAIRFDSLAVIIDVWSAIDVGVSLYVDLQRDRSDSCYGVVPRRTTAVGSVLGALQDALDDVAQQIQFSDEALSRQPFNGRIG